MKIASFLLIGALPLCAQSPAEPEASLPPSDGFETAPILNAAAILQPAYYQGVNFQVNDSVPTARDVKVFEKQLPNPLR